MSDNEAEEDWMNAWDSDLPGPSVVQPGTEITAAADSSGIIHKDEKGSALEHHSAVVINDNKAGMEGLDKDRINQIIYEASRGSPYYKNQQKKEDQLNEQIQELRERQQKLTPQQVTIGTEKADQLIERLEASRDLSHTIVHVDMDAFYAAVEMLDRPELRDKPIAVGGKYMLSTSNYIARRFGVRAAMPGFIARKLCPDLVIVPCNFTRYTEMSEQFQKIFADYDPNFSSMSLDEAYMDITDHLRRRVEQGEDQRWHGYSDPSNVCRCVRDDAVTDGAQCEVCRKVVEKPHYELFGLTAEETIREMRFRIYQETCLTSSAGIAPNTMLAKVCSDRNKPNGQFSIPPSRESVMEFIKDLPIRKIGGIGKVTERVLRSLGITTCSHLYEQRGILFHLYSPVTFEYFMKVCCGIGSSRVERGGQQKSMSVERTFKEHSKPSELEEICRDLCKMLSNDLQSEGLQGKTVTLKLKTVEFEVRTRAQTISCYTNTSEAIFASALEILRSEIASIAPRPLRLRLMGVRLSALTPVAEENCRSQATIESMINRLNCKKRRRNENSGATYEPTSASQSEPLDPDATKRCSLSARNDDNASTSDEINRNQLAVDSQTRDHVDDSWIPSDFHGRAVPSTLSGPKLISLTEMECPVCGTANSWDLNELNQHIDICLNRSAVRDILTSEKRTEASDRGTKVATPSTAKCRKLAPSNNSTLHKFFEARTDRGRKVDENIDSNT